MSTYVRIMSIHLTVAGLFSSSTRRRRPLCQGSGDKVAKTFETSATSRVHLVVEVTGELKKKKKKERKTRVQREIKRGICRGTDARCRSFHQRMDHAHERVMVRLLFVSQ